jgi:MYXO-CTERM domain-containing protein
MFNARFVMSARTCTVATAALAVLAAPSAASAAIIAGSLAFTATSFPGGAPVDPISGRVNFSFDNSANFRNAENGSTQNGAPVHVSASGLNLPGSWTPVMTYFKSGTLPNGTPVEDLLSISHTLDGTIVNPGNDDWRVAFNTISTNPSFLEFTYARSTAPGTIFMTFTGTASAVPKPTSLALFIIGLAGLGVRRRRAS